MLGRGRVISLYTLNGQTILEHDVCVEGDDAVVSCAFYEGSGNEYLERDLIFTGQKKGVANVRTDMSVFEIREGTDSWVDLEQSYSGWRLRPRAC